MKRFIGCTVFVLLGSGLGAWCPAASTSGQVSLIAPPASVKNDVLESNSLVYLFAERQSVTLAAPLSLDMTQPGTVPSNVSTNLSPGTLPAGTVVNSYFFHYDEVGDPGTSNPGLASGSVTFDTPVLGLILFDSSLDDSNAAVGLSTTTYSPAVGHGLEIVAGGVGKTTNDQITLQPDLRTIIFDFRDGTAPDQMRVITAVPEPAAIAWVGLTTAALLGKKRRR